MTGTMTTCDHSRPRRHSYRAFSGPVASDRYVDERAHGNVRCIESCACGARRDVNVNGMHEEYGPWIGGLPRPHHDPSLGEWQEGYSAGRRHGERDRTRIPAKHADDDSQFARGFRKGFRMAKDERREMSRWLSKAR